MTTFHELSHVYAGPMTRVLPLQAALGALGFRTEIAGEAMKQIDPFATPTGTIGALDVDLLAPRERAEETRRAIALLEAEAVTARRASGEHPTVLEDLATLGRRIRWSACMGITAPLGVLLGVRYMAESDGLAPRPRLHGYTVAAFVVCILEVTAMTLGLARMLGVARP